MRFIETLLWCVCIIFFCGITNVGAFFATRSLGLITNLINLILAGAWAGVVGIILFWSAFGNSIFKEFEKRIIEDFLTNPDVKKIK